MEKEPEIALKQALLDESKDTNHSAESEEKSFINSYGEAVWHVCKKAAPLVIGSFGNSLKPTIVYAYINVYCPDNTIFASVGLGVMLMNIFLRSYVTGFNNFMITNISHAFGAGDYYEIGEIMNKNKVICTFLLIPLMTPLFFIGYLLVLIGQDPEVSMTTQYFVRIAMPGFFSQLHYDIYKKYLNSIGLYSSNMPIPLVSLIFHFAFCYLFIGYYDLGLTGAAIVTLLQPVCNHLLILLVVSFGDGSKYLHNITHSSFVGWIQIIREGIPNYFLQFVTTISLEVLILFTGFISIKLVVANTSFINIFFLLFIAIIGVQQSSGPMIGNKIGQGDYTGALKIIKANFIFGIAFGF